MTCKCGKPIFRDGKCWYCWKDVKPIENGIAAHANRGGKVEKYIIENGVYRKVEKCMSAKAKRTEQ